jgi:hypothetical protein
MSKVLVMCAATSMWLSMAALDRANAIGTFRLEGPWPSSSAQGKADGAADFAWCSHEQWHHALPHKHLRQACFRSISLAERSDRCAPTFSNIMAALKARW